MLLAEFVIKVLDDIHEEVDNAINGMNMEQLLHRPEAEANGMAWLAWHVARTQDQRASHLQDLPQLWVADGWHARFGLDADPKNTGRGHNDEQVAAVRPESPEVLRDYCTAAYRRARAYVESLPPGAEDGTTTGPDGLGGPLSNILFRMVHGGIAHSAQLAYVRGLIEHRHWFPR